MNKIKKELLFLQSEKANIKIRELADLLKKSSQRLKYSIDTIEKQEIIYNPHCIFDYSYFGLILFRVYFKEAYISEKDKYHIISRLSADENVVAVYEISGEFDLVVEIESQNPSRFNKVIKKIADEFPTLSHYKIILNVVTHLYPRYYMIEDKTLQSLVKPQIIIGGDREIEQFDKNDLAVMKNLLDNPRSRLTTLAKQSGLNIKTAKSALKDLQERSIIKGFRYVVDMNKLDITKFRLFLHLHNLSHEREQDLQEYLKNTSEVIQVNKTVGDWDIEIDIESSDKTRIRKLIFEMREVFKDIIETFNMMEFYKYYKRSYLPECYFRQEQTN